MVDRIQQAEKASRSGGVDLTTIVKFRENKGTVETQKSLTISTPGEMRQRTEKIKTTETRIFKINNVGEPSKPRIKSEAKKTNRVTKRNRRAIKGKDGLGGAMGPRKGDSLSLGRGKTKAMVSGPTRNSSDSRLEKRTQGRGGRASGIDRKVINIEGRTDTMRERGNNVININKEKGSTKDATLRDTFKLGERVGQRVNNTDTKRTSGQKITEKDTHITTNAKRTEGTQDMETPGGIKSLLDIKENSKDMQPGRKRLTNERLKLDQRI